MERVIELLKRAQQGDKEARNTLVEENVGLVWSIVRRFTGRGYEPEDLFQIGTIGLMKAVDYFNIEYDVRFSTYAVPMITGEIKRFLRDDGMIKVSRTIKDNACHVRKCAQDSDRAAWERADAGGAFCRNRTAFRGCGCGSFGYGRGGVAPQGYLPGRWQQY